MMETKILDRINQKRILKLVVNSRNADDFANTFLKVYKSHNISMYYFKELKWIYRTFIKYYDLK